ncbi:MAG: CapA family protein [Faecalibacillus faecis]|uniref:CapA family protein n=1 Tax=Faecalibacillus faecis TaxID=1982628 RepID=UPI0039936CBA
MMNNRPYLVIGGDLVPTKKNTQEFISGNIDTLLGEKIKQIWNDSEYRIFNLETPISNSKKTFEKAGTFLGAKAETFNGIKNLNPDLICLANNHIMDLGIEGAQDTISLLNANNIQYVGFGSSIDEMNDFCLFEYNDKKIGIYNCCEHEFTYARTDRCGTNPFNPLQSLFRIKDLSKKCDFLVVIYHGGKELYQYCSPKLKETCHAMVEAGANVVLCQHSHCVSCYEVYNDSTILYGQGNFIFDLDEPGKWNELTCNGILVRLYLDDFSIDFLNYHKDGKKIELDDNQINEDLIDRSNKIIDDNFVRENYISEIRNTSYHYFRQLLSTKVIGAIDKKIFKSYFMKRRYKKMRLYYINYFDCEVHMENILTYLKEIKELYQG